MAEFNSVVEWLQTCPALANLWAVSGTIQDYNNVVKVNDVAPLYSNASVKMVDGRARVSGVPNDDYYITYTIQCFKNYEENANGYNLSAYDDTQDVCDWLIEQQNTMQTPVLKGQQVYFIECLTPVPLEQWVDSDMKTIAYYVTVRLHIKNPAKRVEYKV